MVLFTSLNKGGKTTSLLQLSSLLKGRTIRDKTMRMSTSLFSHSLGMRDIESCRLTRRKSQVSASQKSSNAINRCDLEMFLVIVRSTSKQWHSATFVRPLSLRRKLKHTHNSFEYKTVIDIRISNEAHQNSFWEWNFAHYSLSSSVPGYSDLMNHMSHHWTTGPLPTTDAPNHLKRSSSHIKGIKRWLILEANTHAWAWPRNTVLSFLKHHVSMRKPFHELCRVT